MEKFKQLQKLKEIYAEGGNIIQYLHSLDHSTQNSIEDILISYDFQAGSYVKSFSQNREHIQNYTKALAEKISELGELNSLMEVGVGEATTLNSVLANLDKQPRDVFGFDISWSRLSFASNFLNDFGHNDVKLFAANLFEIPLPDNSIDVIYTSHSIEPNGGNEEAALKELYRVAGKYIVLLEPSYELGNEEARSRMKKHGYVTRLLEAAQELGMNIVEHRLFDHCINPLNPTGLIIIEKNSKQSNESNFICPISRTELTVHNDSFLFSDKSMLAYPVLEGIPCLLKDNSILATHLQTDYESYKRENNIDFN